MAYELQGSKYIVEAGDSVNEAVNEWGFASGNVSRASLRPGALSKVAAAVEDQYAAIQDEAIERLRASQEALMAVREAMYRVAGLYSGAEEEAKGRVQQEMPRTHRPELDDPRYV